MIDYKTIVSNSQRHGSRKGSSLPPESRKTRYSPSFPPNQQEGELARYSRSLSNIPPPTIPSSAPSIRYGYLHSSPTCCRQHGLLSRPSAIANHSAQKSQLDSKASLMKKPCTVPEPTPDRKTVHLRQIADKGRKGAPIRPLAAQLTCPVHRKERKEEGLPVQR